jgi:GTPase SAR1 family protein
MSTPILILGDSGSGKSTAIRNLPPSETVIVNVCSKELPFMDKEGNGNVVCTDDYDKITGMMKYVNDKPAIKYIVIDDSQYLLVNEFMKRHGVSGKGNDIFTLYNELGDHFWKLLWNSKFYRDDLFIFFLHHTEISDTGIIKAKSIGKMLDEKVNIPGMFTIVLLSKRDGDKNYFFTQNDGTHPAKTPMGMFEEQKIDNDLLIVANKIKSYYEED